MKKECLILVAAALVLSALPSHAKCGEDGVLETVESMIRQKYFSSDDPYFAERKNAPPKELTLSSVRATGRNSELGIYRCAATVEFDATEFEAVYYFGLNKQGPNGVPVRFEVSPDARDPSKNIISVRGIPALSRNPRIRSLPGSL